MKAGKARCWAEIKSMQVTQHLFGCPGLLHSTSLVQYVLGTSQEETMLGPPHTNQVPQAQSCTWETTQDRVTRAGFARNTSERRIFKSLFTSLLFVCLFVYLEGLRNMENFFKFKRNWNPKPHTSSEVIYASKELLAHMKSFNPSFEAFHIQNRMGTERKGQIGMTCRAWKKEEVVTPSSHAHIILLSWLPSASNEAKQILKSNLFVNILLKSMGDFAEIAHGSRPH